jgi:ubiquinone/menaquinone biosynthesis C-methylase UbiE
MSTPPAASYKVNWNKLAETEESALLHVAGYTDEAELKRNTDVTIDVLRSTIGVHSTDVVLEIGCGVGRVGRQLAPLVLRWIGCDVAENMLSFARHRLNTHKNIELVPVSGYDLRPISDNSIDAVYCTVVFMHLEEWDRFTYVREAFRILKPGGRFYCDNVNLACESGWRVFLQSAAFPAQARPQHVSRCSTIPELTTYLTQAGFQNVRTMTPDPWIMVWGSK